MDDNKGKVWSVLLAEKGYPELVSYEWLTVEEAQEKYPFLFYVYKAVFPMLSDQAVAQIVAITVDVCPHCYETLGVCSCMRDD